MLRKAASKVAWVGRTASMVFGLALVLGLIFGVATMALGANGKPFLLGKKNVATAVSTLVKKGAGPALSLKVGSGAPLAVNSSQKVTNLNADKVDGSDGELWAQILANGFAENWKGLTGNGRTAKGSYLLSFDRDISACAVSATPVNTDAYATVDEYRGGFLNPNQIRVHIEDSTGAFVDSMFDVVVFCGDHQSA